ncbi:MAG: hypothetical protein N3B13_12495 [Deltaproteobacteria bacterium]|nr:hypothetical protein [Deltaproteobacteria bacterium]
MRNCCMIILLLMTGVLFFNCSEDKNACQSYYDKICSKEKFFDEAEEYYYQQKVLLCNCVKNKRSDFTDYEKMECDRMLKSLEELNEDVPDQKKILQECSVQNRLLDKYGDDYISVCLLRNGTEECNNSKADCIKKCPTDSDEKYKGCIAECNAKYPCDEICDGFEFN